ncbi:hypothetical protein GY45DRAFT_1208893, partial [Cubamyces sp. BRFM 1775]
RALDIGTGLGEWYADLPCRLPAVDFYGIDIVPVFTRRVPSNVTFEIQDFNDGLCYRSEYMDLVRAQDISLGVESYPRLVREAARILKVGGVLSVCEWTRTIFINRRRDITRTAPRACLFLMVLADCLYADCYAGPVVDSLRNAVTQEPRLSVQHEAYCTIPIGDWPDDIYAKSIGARYRRVLVDFATAMAPFLRRALHADDVDDLVDGFVSDLYSVAGLSTTYYSAYVVR